MRVLLACEESQIVTKAFREKGHEAFSCDILPCSGGHPEWHYEGDVLSILDGLYVCECGHLFEYGLGKYGCCDISRLLHWDMMIGFPPCDHLAISGAAWFERKRADGSQRKAIDFFMKLWESPIPKICLENPINILMGEYVKTHFPDIAHRFPFKPHQIIHPYYFGDSMTKKTCLWLKGLKPLYHNKTVNLFDKNVTHVQGSKKIKGKNGILYNDWHYKTGKGQGGKRSKFHRGVANAMADQWG